jgi:hypothetical protein
MHIGSYEENETLLAGYECRVITERSEIGGQD